MIQAPHSSTVQIDAPLILIVEDEAGAVTAMEYKLALEGYRTRSAYTGEQALAELARVPLPDLVLLDVMLPDITGLDICLKIRQAEETAQIPVIMLTAKGEEIDRVVGLEMGADDYLVKPFSIRELMLRIKIALRRREPQEEEEALTKKSVCGRLSVDHDCYKVFVDDLEISLTATEFKLLGTFLERADRVQSRDFLLDVIWGVQSFVQTRTVDSHVKQLRKKLGPAAEYIETIRGVGYRFNTPAP